MLRNGNKVCQSMILNSSRVIHFFLLKTETATKIAGSALVSEHEGIRTKICNLTPGWVQSSSNQYQTHKPYLRKLISQKNEI